MQVTTTLSAVLVLLIVQAGVLEGQQNDIVQTATTLNFTILVQALNASGLNAVLNSSGPFTVFAPTDAAFSKLPNGTLEDLLKKENKQKLVDFLNYHVIDGRVTAANLTVMSLPTQVQMLSDLRAVVDKDGDKVTINNAVVLTPNVIATNGIIHAIDTVLMPPTDIVQTATALKFTILAQALTTAELVAKLQGSGPFTVFAPTDAAFSKLPNGTLDDLRKAENKDKLIKLLQYHVFDGLVTAASINAKSLPAQVKMLSAVEAVVDKDGDKVTINNAVVFTPNVIATNGIIHAIDTVLMPPTDIVQTADASNFTLLLRALNAAELVATLKGKGPFTLFAPTDAAFNKLSKEDRDDLFKPEEKAKLVHLLKYHVVNGLVTVAEIRRMMPEQSTLRTLSNDSLQIYRSEASIKINSATVTLADVFNSNGITHVIDTVLMKPKNTATSFYTGKGYYALLLVLMEVSYHSWA